MKKTFTNLLALSFLCFGSMQMTSCKKKAEVPAETTVTTTTETQVETEAAPVEIASDDQLETNVKDAVKDFPGVTATVTDGEITLTGEITRDRLATLMQGLHALHPKKINNNLTVKK